MKFSTLAFVAVLITSDAFAFQPALNNNRARGSATELFAAAKEAEVITMSTVRNSIDNLTKENFSATLTKIEPFLLETAGATLYAKSMRRIARNAKHLGVEVPDKYAFEAACTSKRRAKQDAFIQAKEAEGAAETADAE